MHAPGAASCPNGLIYKQDNKNPIRVLIEKKRSQEEEEGGERARTCVTEASIDAGSSDVSSLSSRDGTG